MREVQKFSRHVTFARCRYDDARTDIQQGGLCSCGVSALNHERTSAWVFAVRRKQCDYALQAAENS